MPASQPIASMIVTAAQRASLTAADFSASTPYNAALESVSFLCGVKCVYKHSAAGPHYLELYADIAAGTPTEAPIWTMDVAPINQAAPTAGRPPTYDAFPYPIAVNRLDVVFVDKPWGASARTFFKPSSDINVILLYYPSTFV